MAALMESLTDEMDIPNLRDREDYASSTRRPATQEGFGVLFTRFSDIRVGTQR
jgi:hypothetical protein